MKFDEKTHDFMDAVIELINGDIYNYSKRHGVINFETIDINNKEHLLLLKLAELLHNSMHFEIRLNMSFLQRVKLYYKIHHKLGYYEPISKLLNDTIIRPEWIVADVAPVLAKMAEDGHEFTLTDIYTEYYEN